MSLLSLGGCLALTIGASFGFFYLSLYLSMMNTVSTNGTGNHALKAERYRPMLRLLSEKDLAPVRHNNKLRRRMRADRTAIFRGYLHCVARDYGKVLAGLSLAAVQSNVDRPDLAVAIMRNRLLFAGALCRLDMLSLMYRFGVRGVDVSGFLEALDGLRVPTARAMVAPAAIAI